MNALSSEPMTTLLPALIAAQAAFKPAVKDARNTHYGNAYLTLSATLDAIMPALNANGLALVQHVMPDGDNGLLLITRLYHSNGEWLSSEYPVSPTRADPQGLGSALTYGRRYAVMALVGIAPEDDDGEAASGPSMRSQTAKQTSRPRRALQRTQMPMDPETAAAALADALDNATTADQLAELAETLKTLPEWLLPPLRERYTGARERIRANDERNLFPAETNQ